MSLINIPFTIGKEGPILNCNILQKPDYSVLNIGMKHIFFSPFIIESYSNLKAQVISQKVIPFIHIHPSDLVGDYFIQKIFFRT